MKELALRMRRLCVVGLALFAAPVAATAETIRIDKPQVEGVALDWCRSFGKRCGQPAADAFCRANGHRQSLRFVKWENPGFETRVISDGRICSIPECDTFRWIECRG